MPSCNRGYITRRQVLLFLIKGRSGKVVDRNGQRRDALGFSSGWILPLSFPDILQVGCYLNEQNLVEVLTEEGPQRAEELIQWGAKELHMQKIT